MAQANIFGSYPAMVKYSSPDAADNVELVDRPEPGDTADSAAGDEIAMHQSAGPMGQPQADEMGY